mmetsp:Transcript_66610/g.149411  ORF Transcript_66610/g.149411 Transcript_66610/m.149411 type:complete len:133 (-) Transcript_66610:147-545(-)
MARPRAPRLRSPRVLPLLAAAAVAAAAALQWRGLTGFLAVGRGRGPVGLHLSSAASATVLLAPGAPAVAQDSSFFLPSSEAVVQIGLVLGIIGLIIGLLTTLKPEPEDWQKDLDAELTVDEWQRSDGPSIDM